MKNRGRSLAGQDELLQEYEVGEKGVTSEERQTLHGVGCWPKPSTLSADVVWVVKAHTMKKKNDVRNLKQMDQYGGAPWRS